MSDTSETHANSEVAGSEPVFDSTAATNQQRYSEHWTPPPPAQALASKTPLIIAAVVAVVLLVGFITTTILWLSAKSDLASANASIAAASAAESSRQAEADAVPDLEAVASKYFTGATGDAKAIRINLSASNVSKLEPELSGLLTDLGFSSAVLERMQATRALDGTLTANGKNCNVSWTYHPDHGLTMVFEVS